MAKRFYGKKAGVPDWYTTYGKSATAEAGEFVYKYRGSQNRSYLENQSR